MFFLFAIYGIVIGSFLNVVILRVPAGESITFDRSHCPHCGYQLKWYDLFPVLSYLALGGRCRKCKTSISVQYPLIELLNGAAYVGLYFILGLQPMTVVACLVFSTLLCVFVIDWRHYIIPNGLVITLLVLGIAASIIQGDYFNHIIGFFAVSLILLMIALIVPGGMGMGDVKLMAAAGLLLGWQKVILALMLGAIIGSLIGVGLIVTKVKSRKDQIPFGPYLSIGIMLSMLIGDLVIQWYLLEILHIGG